MGARRFGLCICGLAIAIATLLAWQDTSTLAQGLAAEDPIKVMVGRLDLERYKTTIRAGAVWRPAAGTDRNRRPSTDRGPAVKPAAPVSNASDTFNSSGPPQDQQTVLTGPLALIASGEFRPAWAVRASP